MRSLFPVLALGLVLFGIVITASYTQRKMHEYETRPAPADSPNSAANDFAEKERMATQFPDTLLDHDGIRYKILREGSGPKPIAGDHVSANYIGRLLDGTEFDNSYKRGEPIEFVIMKGQVIRGWDLVIKDMRKGERRLVVIPSDLGYGARGSPPKIPPHASLVFEIELVDFH